MDSFIDLFSGIGGFHIALKQKGLNCVFASDIDKAASTAYKRNFGLDSHSDICQIGNAEIPQHDILCAGFPCQPFSRSGKRKGLNDDRGRLFYEIVRIAKHHKPMLMILENVRTILTIDNGKIKKEIYKSIKNLGYHLDHVILNASEFGIPQKRERVYFVAIKNDCPLKFASPKPNKKKRYLRDILVKGNHSNLIVNRTDIVIEKHGVQDKALKPIRIGYLNKGGQGERIYSVNGHAITLSADGGGVGHRTGLYYVDNKVRRLHIDEAKQCMGFDKDHIVSDGISGYRQLGNAVIPTMISHIYDNILSST